MPDFLSTGVSGLLAFRRALDVTSHNIANVATDGYSRQRAELSTRPPQPYGDGWVGSGAQVSTVRRMYDDALAYQSRSATSNFSRFDTFATQAERVNNLFGSSTTGLTTSLQKFTNALQDLSNNPTSAASRQAVLSEAQALVERLKTYDAQLAQYDSEIESRLATEATEISTLAGSIAQLNQEIATGLASTGQPPNDLLDQRDRLLDELSGHINVSVVGQSDGQVNVYIGNGQSLVLGNQASQLSISTSPYDPTRHGIAVRTANGSADITQNLTGGTLGGVLDFREEVLDPARNSLGRIAFGLSEVVNEQHSAGMDLRGAMGQDLFAAGGVETFRHSANTSSASLSVNRSDAGALTEADYTLEMTTSGWTLRRQDTGAMVPLTGTGTAADPLRADGLEIAVNGAASIGDRFLIRPTRATVEGLDVLISDPSRIAAAMPVRTAAGISNSGTASVSSIEITDPTNAQLRSAVTIEFLTPTTYSINGAGTYTLNSDNSIDYNGWQLQINGTPTAGDQFTVSDNSSGTGDNRNALKLAEALRTPVLDGGTASLDATANRLVGDVGITTRQAQASRDAQQVVQQDSFAARDAVSGVNLDEEAANMLRYQQAYQAAAQLIRVASTLFDSLLAATQR